MRQIERYYQTQLVRHGAHIRSIFAAWAKRTGLSALVNTAGSSQIVESPIVVGTKRFPGKNGGKRRTVGREPGTY